MRFIANITFLGLLCSSTCSFGNAARSACNSDVSSFKMSFQKQTDSTEEDSAKLKVDTTRFQPKSKRTVFSALESKGDDVDPKKLAIFPAFTLQQYLKGEAAGLYVQESSGEPGTVQNMFIRGTSQPLVSPREQFATQPLVVLDGIPLVGEHPFAYDIQQFKFDRIGPATNTLSNINMDNIESVKILRDLGSTSIYGPKGVNGVIVLTSKRNSTVRRINFESYIGVAQPNAVTTINGKFENDFRRQFYDKYTANGSYSGVDSYPLYLSDSLNNDFYGPSNWNDKYYGNALSYSVNAGISGGSERANFRFGVGTTTSGGVADKTGADRYNTRFQINMRPTDWMAFTAIINANRIDRQRNKNVRDRLSQVNYIPDLSSPIAPNNVKYEEYLAQFDKGFDNNRSNVVEGLVRLAIDLGKFKFNTTFGVDNNEGYRDIFYARTLLQTTNYASNYYGYSRRMFFDNTATYDLKINDDHMFNFVVGSSFQYDTYKYNYAYAYKGANDFVKLNLLQSDPNRGDYLEPFVFKRELVWKFLDKTRNNQISFTGRANYNYKEIYTFSAMLRADASSNQQPTNRWFYSPIFSGSWNMKKDFFDKDDFVSDLNLRASVGRMGRAELFDNYAQGPQYTAFIGFTGNLIAPGYNGFGTLTRPYNAGAIPYNLEWAYQDQLNVGVDFAFLKNRIRTSIDLYSKEDKNQLLGVPGAAEYGYNTIVKNGMSIANSGIDAVISADILPSTNKVSWTSSLNLNFNKNKLKALPGGLSELIVGDRLLKVGESVDSYWLLTNQGIFNTDAEVPVGTNGEKMSYNAITLKAGDPRWKDLNGDNLISNKDKTLMGHALPVVSGGFNNEFGYGNWSLTVNMYFNLGRDLINQEMANRFDFVNREGLNNINSVREVTYWEKRGDYSKYPLYNPWSSSAPYQVNQDLFLEDGSFLKLRTLSLGYDLTKLMKKKMPKLERFYVYGSVYNVFTLTKYTGQDPELVNYTGYDSGYGMQIPRTYMLGVKMNF